jgi:hypothetical protein
MARLEKPSAIKMKVPMVGARAPPERIKVATVAMPIETEAAPISVVVGEPDFRFIGAIVPERRSGATGGARAPPKRTPTSQSVRQ